MTILEKQCVIENQLNSYKDWDDKFLYIIEKGNTLPDYPLFLKKEEYLVRECQSKLYLYCTLEDNKMTFLAHSDTVIVRGIVGIFIELFSNESPDEILKTTFTFLSKSGILKLFSNRSTGIVAILKRIHEFAEKYK